MTQLPVAPKRIRNRLNELAKRPTPTSFGDGKRGVLVNLLNEALKQLDPVTALDQADTNRRKVLGWLFTPDLKPYKPLSTKVLTPQQLNAVWQWVSPWKDESSNKWIAQDYLQMEAIWILDNANVAQAAVDLFPDTPIKNLAGVLEIELPDGVEQGDTVAEALNLPGAKLASVEIGEITW